MVDVWDILMAHLGQRTCPWCRDARNTLGTRWWEGWYDRLLDQLLIRMPVWAQYWFTRPMDIWAYRHGCVYHRQNHLSEAA